MGADGGHALADGGQRVVGEGLAEYLRERHEDLPVVARVARRVERTGGALDAALGVDVGGALLRVGGAGQHQVSGRGAGVAMVALVDDKRRRVELLERNLIGTQQINRLERIERRRRGARHETDVERARRAAGRLDDAVAVPAIAAASGSGGHRLGGSADGGRVGAREGAYAEQDDGPLGRLEGGTEAGRGRSQRGQRGGRVAKVLVLVREVGCGSHRGDLETEVAHHLPNPGVDERRLDADMSAHQQQGVRLFDPGDGGAHRVRGAQVGRAWRRDGGSHGGRGGAQLVEEVLCADHGLDIRQRPRQHADLRRRQPTQRVGG
mmetsp:Transcript_2041/g.6758  ORF Transcript_2041/g.6758 Transcript_2041/m.6758 type:complete len:322 (-) Transcript_2041:1079-2044(-)